MQWMMLGKVGSQSCTIIWLTLLSFGLHPSKRHHDTGFARFPGITEYIELWGSTDSYELRVLRNCGTHKHIGVSASHGAVQFWNNSLPSKGFWDRGLSRCSGAGVGQQVKPRTCRAGGVRVRGNAYSHKATSQTNMNESPQHLARPLSTGEHTTLPHVGSRQTLCNISQSLRQVNPGVQCEKQQRIKTST
jgi:hypothetical protein